ncbi:hypothetical protein JB92DRAFT_2832305 [Gautieria morchelliformis]|nr:hypothetical protein JB92DRAFT_2832305 [Gautieria morchelliformis]
MGNALNAQLVLDSASESEASRDTGASMDREATPVDQAPKSRLTHGSENLRHPGTPVLQRIARSQRPTRDYAQITASLSLGPSAPHAVGAAYGAGARYISVAYLGATYGAEGPWVEAAPIHDAELGRWMWMPAVRSKYNRHQPTIWQKVCVTI